MPFMHGTEWIVIIVMAFLLLGDRMPEYAQRLARFIWQAREMANNAKGQLKEQIGPEYEDINWRQYDPRQYDPRRIVRDALMSPPSDQGGSAPQITAGRAAAAGAGAVALASGGQSLNAADEFEAEPVLVSNAAHWDAEAT